MNNLNNKMKYDKLTYHFKSEDRIPIKINGFNCPLSLITKIEDVSKDLEKAKQNQEKFRSNLCEATRGKRKHKTKEQKSARSNLQMFYKPGEKVFTLFDDYTTVLFKAKYEAKHGKGLKI